ncbi:unnamed protein product [Rotaria socialis]|uniref:Uncharacterized protein n=1 Tax=Rotaria socialis TaxID=392032 RepID=A0A818ASV4_9BILA|nr:unnamed protein product [Rotaria socialis]
MVSKPLQRDQLEFLLKNNDKPIKLKKFDQTDRGSSLFPAFNEILVNGVVQIFVLCDKCRSIITYKSTPGASSSNTTQSTITAYYRNSKSVLPGKLKKQITSAYLDFISLDSRPFEIASGVDFQQFIQMIYNAGRLLLNSRSIEISDFYHILRQYTFLWCYFRATDSDLYLHSFCLCCKPYTLENQTAPNVRNFVYELLLEYGLSLNTNSFIVTDNEPKMIAALRDANRVGSQVVHSYNRIQSDLKIGCIGSYMKIDKIQQIPSDSGPRFGSLGSESDIVRSYPTLGSDAPKNDSHYDNFESIDKDLLSHICNFLQVLEKAITTLSDETQSTLNKSAVVPSNNSSNVNSLTCDLSASSSVDKSTTPVKANI